MTDPLIGKPITPELAAALRTFEKESIGDMVYNIRERELKGWDGPRVVAWSAACTAIENTIKAADKTHEHVLITPETCDCLSDANCPVCDGGLAICSVCGKGESELEEPCTGKVVARQKD